MCKYMFGVKGIETEGELAALTGNYCSLSGGHVTSIGYCVCKSVLSPGRAQFGNTYVR